MSGTEWIDHEKHVAELLGLERTPGSGNQFNDQGDGVRRGHPLQSSFAVMADCKSTVNAQMTLRLDMLKKLEVQSMTAGKIPIMPLRFAARGRRLGHEDYVVLRLDDLAGLMKQGGMA